MTILKGILYCINMKKPNRKCKSTAEFGRDQNSNILIIFWLPRKFFQVHISAAKDDANFESA